MEAHAANADDMSGARTLQWLRFGLLLTPLVGLNVWAQSQQGEQQEAEEQDQKPEQQEVRKVLEDALEEHRPWWMPGERKRASEKLIPDTAFKLRVEENTKLSLDEVVLQIRRSYDGRVVRANETEDGFEVRLLLDGGRIRTLSISPEGRVVRAHVDEP